MNRNRPLFTSSNSFKPAFQYLLSSAANAVASGPPKKSHRNSASLDGLEAQTLADNFHRSHTSHHGHHFDGNNMDGATSRAAAAARHSRNSSNELAPTSIPLIDISRSPSPYPRSNRSAAQSEDEDDDLFEPASSIRPLVHSSGGVGEIGGGGSTFKRAWRSGGLGHFWFGTWLGWQIYVALLVFWVGGCGFGLLLMNRFLLWSKHSPR